MTSLEEQIRSHADCCREQCPALSDTLSKFKPGHLAVYDSDGYERCKLLVPGHPAINIPKEAADVKNYYVRKAFLNARLTDCEADLRLCDSFLPAFEKHPHAMEKLLQDEKLCRLLAGENLTIDPNAWGNADYRQFEGYPEERRVPTEANIFVRSKGEATIVTGLIEISAPFHYEEELILGSVTLHPDFTVLHPRTRKIYIIEHFGMMDDEKYREQTASKLGLYARYGYFPQDNLICFYEKKSEPLTLMKVRKVLRAELL